jgi:hypothetical protein
VHPCCSCWTNRPGDTPPFGSRSFFTTLALQRQWYQRLSDYAFTSGDNFFMIRVPNLIGGLHLELFDLDEALQPTSRAMSWPSGYHPGQSLAAILW